MNVQLGLELIGLMDGTTINGFLRVEGTPLVQRYTTGTDKFIPDFEALADNIKPTSVLILRDSASGSVYIPSNVIWKYNGVTLSFDANGLSTNSGMSGTFKRIDDHPTTIGASSYNLPALRVMRNLVPLSGYDNDRISVSGSVEISGQQIDFSEIGKEVVIEETTGNQYDILITNTKGSQLVSENDTLTETVNIYKDGVLVTDTTGYTFQWHKVLSSGDVAMGTSATQVVGTSDVDNVLKLKCVVSKDASVVATGYDEVTDFSDPYYAEWQIDGITGRVIRSGQTGTVTPLAKKRSDGSIATVSSWDWRIKDNSGDAFVLTGKSADTFQAMSAAISYEDIKRASMGLSIQVGTTI